MPPRNRRESGGAPNSDLLMTVAEAAAEAGVGVDEILHQIFARAYRAYGKCRGQGLVKAIPRHDFACLPTSRLPPGTRYATEEEMRAFNDARASAICPWEFPELPAGVVAPDYVEQTEDHFRAFYAYPNEGVPVDTWFDVEGSIIYADGKPYWTDVRVEAAQSPEMADDCANVEPRAPAEKSERAKKSREDKETDALEIAKMFVVDGVAPNVKDHTTKTMGVLKTTYPGLEDRLGREAVESLLEITFVGQRRSRGNPRQSRKVNAGSDT
jgi:hypothetical protein